MNPIIYIRRSMTDEEEINIAKKYFNLIEQRAHIKENDYIIPRYSSLPYYKELENDIKILNGNLINSYKEHNYVSKLDNWYYDFSNITPKTWFKLDEIKDDDGPFVIKGNTNSKKHSWNDMMFARNKKEAINVFIKLSQDSLIGSQNIYIRKYIPLFKLCDGLNGLPISEEYRFFVFNKKVIGKGFYWSEHYDDLVNKPDVDSVPDYLINRIIKIASQRVMFFVFDVARTQDNNWILIELNDGTMSGLSMINPEELYFNLRAEVDLFLKGDYNV